MPRFSETGHDLVLCQICGRDIDTGRETPKWRIDVTGSRSAGNVCPSCMRLHNETGLVGEKLRERAGLRRVAVRGYDRPTSLYEHCRAESGLDGPALDRYIQRYYGNG